MNIEKYREKKITIILAIGALVVAIAIIAVVIGAIVRAQVKKQQSLPINDTDLGLLKAESSSQQNLIYSPLAIKYGLSILRDGANGDTRTQIEKILNTDSLPEYQDSKNFASMVNAVVFKNDLEGSISEDYTKKIADQYRADVLYDDFKDNKELDRWLNSKTSYPIHGIGLHTDEHAQMTLINTFTVQPEWKSSFKYDETTGVDFYKDDGNTMKAAMMRQNTRSNSVGYRKESNSTIVTMDLINHDDTALQMVMVVSDGKLEQYIKEMTSSTLADIQTAAEKTKKASEVNGGVSLYIPRFNSDAELNLRSDLETLGMMDAFDEEKADFSQISQNKITLSDIAHQANIELSEMSGAPEEIESQVAEDDTTIEIKLNKPFLFLIQNKDNGDVWFVGTMCEPEMWTQ